MKALIRRGPRYAAVSLFCLLLSNAILIGADRMGLSSGLAVLLSAAVLIPVGFLLQARVTFAVSPTLDAFARYAGALATNVPLSWLILLIVHDLCHVDMALAAPLATILLFFWTYLTSSWALRRRRASAIEGTVS